MRALTQHLGCPSSPRTRRYFHPNRQRPLRPTLFSAHAEVFPRPGSFSRSRAPLLRARGGISIVATAAHFHGGSSPRTRRYFLKCLSLKRAAELFSAHAEVFPKSLDWRERHRPLLRARGGISNATSVLVSQRVSSPRTRRYFHPNVGARNDGALFSAHAEVFPWRASSQGLLAPLLRARGGISIDTAQQATPPSSSPRTRRYFHHCGTSGRWGRLFSAHAEVFPAKSIQTFCPLSLLRARGGISSTAPT